MRALSLFLAGELVSFPLSGEGWGGGPVSFPLPRGRLEWGYFLLPPLRGKAGMGVKAVGDSGSEFNSDPGLYQRKGRPEGQNGRYSRISLSFYSSLGLAPGNGGRGFFF